MGEYPYVLAGLVFSLLSKSKNRSPGCTYHLGHLKNKHLFILTLIGTTVNPILFNLFRAIDSLTAGLQKPTELTIYNYKIT